MYLKSAPRGPGTLKPALSGWGMSSIVANQVCNLIVKARDETWPIRHVKWKLRTRQPVCSKGRNDGCPQRLQHFHLAGLDPLR